MGEDKGHPFRGNQYETGVSGGREEAKRAEERGGKEAWLNAAIAQHNAEVRDSRSEHPGHAHLSAAHEGRVKMSANLDNRSRTSATRRRLEEGARRGLYKK